MAKQVVQKKLHKAQLQSKAVLPGVVLNSTTSEGLVPDAVEYAALIAFYNAMGGDNWVNDDNWLQGSTNTDFASWFGIDVVNGDVTYIGFRRNNLTGQLPPKIGDLTSLRGLIFQSNQISSIPKEIKYLTKLEYLNLSGNPLGTLPNEIGSLSNLSLLQISDCQLTSLPIEIGNLSNLEYLEVWVNQLSSIPTTIGNLKKLLNLSLGANNLQKPT